MSHTFRFADAMLADREITDADADVLRAELAEDGKLDLDDVRLLVELYCNAQRRSAAFEDLFFDVLERAILADGKVQLSEQFYLLKMLYSDRQITERERGFLRQLQQKAQQTTPEFDAMCREALSAPTTGWNTGGR
ncbi:MAG: hypothetical protein ACOY3P_10220 [Planctomycetota bacterium]